MSRTGHRTYRAKRARLLRDNDTCHLCGGWINPNHKYPHPMSGTADHITPISKGGHNLGDLAAAHWICNTKRGNKPIQRGTTSLRNW